METKIKIFQEKKLKEFVAIRILTLQIITVVNYAEENDPRRKHRTSGRIEGKRKYKYWVKIAQNHKTIV